MANDIRVIRLITGDIDREQKNDVLQEISKDDVLSDEYHRLKNAWALSSYRQPISNVQVEKSFQALQMRLRKPSSTIWSITLLRYAAIVLIAILSGAIAQKLILNKPTGIEMTAIFKTNTGKDAVIHSPFSQSGLTEIIVPKGQMAIINLPDGSRVWLNSNTTMTYDQQNFNLKNRVVQLNGEAYFDVKKSDKMFAVSTNYGNVYVHGTVFNVCAYSNSPFHATLVEGLISFEKETPYKNETTLHPNQQLLLTESNDFIVRKVNAALYTSWINGNISFVDEPLDELVLKLSRHYDIDILVMDQALQKVRFTGCLKEEGITQVMEYINITKPIRYEYDRMNRKLKIYSGNY
jgi:hypothetical protein